MPVHVSQFPTTSEINSKSNNIATSTYIPSQEKKKIFIIRKIKRSQIWSKEEDQRLKTLAERFKYQNWKEIAKSLGNRSAIQCCSRFKRIRPGIIKGVWTETEDRLLLNLVNKFGKNWSLLSRYMPSRTGKQIRERFINSLDPSINRDKFSLEEDRNILRLYEKYGTCWSKIAENLKDRTADMVKNRFYSCLHKNIHGDGYKEQLRRKKKRLQGNIDKKKKKIFKVKEDAIIKSQKKTTKERRNISFLNSKKNKLSISNDQININLNTKNDIPTLNLLHYDQSEKNYVNKISDFNHKYKEYCRNSQISEEKNNSLIGLNIKQEKEIKLVNNSTSINYNFAKNSTSPIDMINYGNLTNNLQYDPLNLVTQYNRLYGLYYKCNCNCCVNNNRSYSINCNKCNFNLDLRDALRHQLSNLNNLFQASYLKEDHLNIYMNNNQNK